MPQVAFVRKKLFESIGGIDKLTKTLNFITADKGNCTATFLVKDEHTNIHGLFTHKFGNRQDVSINLNVNFYKAAYVGDVLFLDMKTVKIGKNVAFLEVDVFNNVTKQLIMKGSQWKYLSGETKKPKPNKEN